MSDGQGCSARGDGAGVERVKGVEVRKDLGNGVFGWGGCGLAGRCTALDGRGWDTVVRVEKGPTHVQALCTHEAGIVGQVVGVLLDELAVCVFGFLVLTKLQQDLG